MPEATASPLKQLADLLRQSGAISQVNDARLAPSVLYDVQYRVVIVSFAFEGNARSHGGVRRIRADKLKFLQFIALRPWLVPVIKEWSQTRGDAQLSMLTSDRLRRGFLGDSTHDRLIDLLVVAGALVRSSNGVHLMEAPQSQLLTSIRSVAGDSDLFQAERTASVELGRVRVTNEMLEGW